jgi:membrane associated rhomboid family serine protease
LSNYYRPRGFGGFFSFPPVLKNLIIINVIVFLIQNLLSNISFSGVPGWYIFDRWFALNPISGVDVAGQSFNFQIWQLITYQFMHGGFWHIFFNMFILWMFGASIEDVMGSKKFLIFYLLSGISAGLFQLFITPLLGAPAAITIGASGSIFGVMIAFAMFFPDSLIYVWFLIPVKAKYFIGFLVIVEFFAVNSASSDVAHLAHLGGALFGFLFILFDKNSYVGIKNIFRKSYYTNSNTGKNIFDNFSFKSKRKQADVEDAKFYDIKEHGDIGDNVTQKEIDKILDKIGQSGYQNLTEREKKVLFEASKKMNKN